MDIKDANAFLGTGAGRAVGQAYATAKDATPEWGRATGNMIKAQQLDLRMRMLLGALHGMNPMSPELPVIDAPDMMTVLTRTYEHLEGVDRVLKTIEGMYRRDLPVGQA